MQHPGLHHVSWVVRAAMEISSVVTHRIILFRKGQDKSELYDKLTEIIDLYAGRAAAVVYGEMVLWQNHGN